MPRRVHLVGTLGGEHPHPSMTLALTEVGQYLVTLPDGEPGERANWVKPMIEARRHRPEIITLHKSHFGSDLMGILDGALYMRKPGHEFTSETFGLRYAEYAFESWPAFEDVTKDRTDIRFQVGIASPFDVAVFSWGSYYAQYYAQEADAAAAQVAAIEDRYSDRVTYQLEIPVETCFVAKAQKNFQTKTADEQGERIAEFIARTPLGSQWIIHLCVGDPLGKPLVTLKDTEPLVILTNAICKQWPRGYVLDAVHMPFGDGLNPSPTTREYYSPLNLLSVPEDIDLLAGLSFYDLFSHSMATNLSAISLDLADTATGRQMGVSTHCGFGRRPEAAERILRTLASLACT
jgi:hypothetical protein